MDARHVGLNLQLASCHFKALYPQAVARVRRERNQCKAGPPYFFFVYRDTRREYRWRYYAPNNRIIADSAEGYVNLSDCLAAIGLVKTTSASASIAYHESAKAA